MDVLWQGALLAPVLVLFGLGALWFAYRRTWSGPQRWMEATRHQHRLALAVGRLIWFRWIHLDCQYWIFHVDFSKGPIELHGMPTPSVYWSFTYTTWTEVNSVLNNREVTLNEDGSYNIVMAQSESESEPGSARNRIPVRPDAGKGVIYFRIYEAEETYPVNLPEVRQGGRVLAHGGNS